MSGNELAYMTDDFDLPRWHQHDPLSSSAQAAHAAQQAVYTGNSYNQAPPPPPQSHPLATSRQPPIINTHHALATQGESQPTSARNPRLSHFFDDGQTQYLSTNQVNLSRSQSLGAPVGSAGAAGIGSGGLTARRNRQQMPDDLESAYLGDSTQANPSDRHQQHRSLDTSQQISQSFYPPSVSYAAPQQPQLTGHSVNSSGTDSMGGDLYQDQYSTSTGQARRQTSAMKLEEVAPTSRSPRRAQTGQGQAQMMDPYAQIQQMTTQTPSSTAYSPTSTAYQYANPAGMTSASPYQSSAQQQQAPIKIEETAASPLGSPFAGQRALPPHPPQAPSHYNSYIEAPSPGPSQNSSQHHYASQASMPLRQTMSTPNTPLGYQHAQNQMQQAQYHSMEDNSMYVDPSAHRRRPSGFRRVHDNRDMQPYVNAQPAGRRQDANGQFLSVSSLFDAAFRRTVSASCF